MISSQCSPVSVSSVSMMLHDAYKTIDINNLWGEGDEGDELSSDDGCSVSPPPSPTDSIDSTSSSSSTKTFLSIDRLSCKCSTLIELSNFVSSSTGSFFKEYRSQRPVLLTDYANQWSVMKHANLYQLIKDLYIQEHSSNTVSVLRAFDKIHFFGNGLCYSDEMKIEDVLSDRVMEGEHNDPFYCRLRPIPKSFSNIFHLDFDESNKNVLFKRKLSACWIGTKGSITPLHFDTCHGFLAVVKGIKRVTLFPAEDSMYLYRDTRSSSVNPNSSKCDYEIWRDDILNGGNPRFPPTPLDGVDVTFKDMYSKMEEASPREVYVHGGQMLYIPPGCWHTVENVTLTVSVLLPCDMTGEEDLHPALHLF